MTLSPAELLDLEDQPESGNKYLRLFGGVASRPSFPMRTQWRLMPQPLTLHVVARDCKPKMPSAKALKSQCNSSSVFSYHGYTVIAI